MKHSTIMLAAWAVVACLASGAWAQQAGRTRPASAATSPAVLLEKGMDGEEICRKLRQQESTFHPYVIMLTGKGRKKDLVRGFEAGADDYVTKPFDCDELRARVRAGERIVKLQIESAVALDSLRKQASHDALTGVLNRTAILKELEREFSRALRAGEPVAVVMSDLDHFKSINDTHGHIVGDFLLAETAKAMASTIRSYESVGRYGGEEFLILLSGSGLDGAAQAAERCRREIASRKFVLAGTHISITASFGVACTLQFETPTKELLVQSADAALYKAKHNGRNQVVAADTPCMSTTDCGPWKL